jgi:hypothetical protein
VQLSNIPVAIALLFVWTMSLGASIDIQSQDPAIGGYYFFAALDRRCSEKNPARSLALERYRRYFIASARKVMSAYPASQTAQAMRAIDELEKNGPAQSQIEKFDSTFSGATQSEIDNLCQTTPKDISDRITIEKLAQNIVESPEKPGYLSKAYLEKVGPPFGFLSLQHLYAILKRCETVAPDSKGIEERARAFQELLDRASSPNRMWPNGMWRTFYDPDGNIKETHFPSARSMFESPEFAVDMRRYHERVALVRPEAQKNDCAEFVTLVSSGIQKK